MFIMELFNNDAEDATGYRVEKDDNSVMHLNDLRKTKITLSHLNKLRQAADVRRYEHEDKLKKISSQYKPAADSAAMGGMPGL